MPELTISHPPDKIFKYRFNRIAPAQKVLESENTIFMLERMDYDQPQGIYAYFQGVKYPAKGHPFPEALYACNFAKKLIRETLGFLTKKDLLLAYIGLAVTPKKKKILIAASALIAYRNITDTVLLPYYLHDRYYSPFCAELRKFIITFLAALGINEMTAERFAENFVILIEYDNAYRFRLEDAFSETNKERLVNDTRRTLRRLVGIIKDREPSHGGATFDKFDQGVKIICYLLYIPWFKKAFIKAVSECDFEKLQLDEDDRYHVLLWADYNFLGKSLEERIEIYKKIHTENGELKLPTRMTYKHTPT